MTAVSRTVVDTDVFVAGGGPAGLAAAIAARLAGFRVALADRRRPPIDKACGEGLMPDGVSLLAELGVRILLGSGFSFAGIRFVDGDVEAEARFRRGSGLGIRRTVLHDALMRRAGDLGVRFLWERRVLGLRPDGAELQDGRVRSRWVIGADGKNSPIRKALGLDAPPSHQRVGLRRHYQIRPWSDLVEVHWGAGCEAYVTPVGEDRICLALLLNDPSAGFDGSLAQFPVLTRRLVGARKISGDLGDVTVTRRIPGVVRGRVALVGEASGSVDAITGEGITLALHQAVVLARALLDEDLEAYARRHRRLMRLPVTMGGLLLAVDRHPGLRRGILKGLAAVPTVFSNLLALHTRALPLMSPAPRLSFAGSAGAAGLGGPVKMESRSPVGRGSEDRR